MGPNLSYGTLLQGRWLIEGVLGAGGQATTYAGRDTTTGQPVAIKHLRLGTVDDWKTVELFEREGHALAQLDHPSIPRYLAAFHVDEGGAPADAAPAGAGGGFFLVQERIDGTPLSRLLDRGLHATEEQIRRLVEDVLRVLVYLHGLHPPVVHRDIKPSNLMLRPDGHYALIDFGVLQAATPAGDEAGSTIVGTAGYVAPEQLMGRPEPASDLYSLGATAIHLATGRHPGELPTKGMRLQWHEHAAGLDPALLRVLDRLTEPAPEARYRSAKTALRALRPRRSSHPSRAKRRVRMAAWGLVAVVAVVAFWPAVKPVLMYFEPTYPEPTDLGPTNFELMYLEPTYPEASPPSGAPGLAPPALPSSHEADVSPPPAVTFQAPEGLTWTPSQVDASWGSYLTLTGTVRNDTNQPLAVIEGRVRAYDAAGTLVGAADARSWPSYKPALLPGESAPLQMSPCKLSAPPARVDIRLTSEPAETSDASAVSSGVPVAVRWDVPRGPGVALEVRERSWRELDIWQLEGAPPVWRWTLDVTNTGQRPLTFVELEAEAVDAQGQVIPAGQGLNLRRSYVVGKDPLPPGATTAVRLTLKAVRPIHERRLSVVDLRVPR